MGTEETHALGYELVDDDPDTSVLLATTDATARWEATLQLREWERHQLRHSGVSGSSTWAAVSAMLPSALAADLGEAGELVGVSNEMVTAALSRAIAARCRGPLSVDHGASRSELVVALKATALTGEADQDFVVPSVGAPRGDPHLRQRVTVDGNGSCLASSSVRPAMRRWAPSERSAAATRSRFSGSCFGTQSTS